MLDWKRFLKSLFKKSSLVKADDTAKKSVTLLPGGDEVIPNSSGIYRCYTAPDKKTAMEFLNKQDITAPSYFVVVETPEGTFAKDRGGIFGHKR